MKRTQRYLSAWSRHHRSGGFGIHSPHAYRFVRSVLRERLPYYAYGAIGSLIDAVKASTTPAERRATGVVSKKTAKLLFRVANYVTPLRIFQAGVATGVESVVMLSVDSRSRLWLYDPDIERNALAARVLHTQVSRIECHDTASVAVDRFLSAGDACEEATMALLNMPIDVTAACRLLDSNAVVVICNMQRNKSMSELYDACCRHMATGQTFTNGKTAILIPSPRLQREDFELWL